MLRFLTAGESHGPALSVIVEGLPAGLPVNVEGIQAELTRRRAGHGRGPRMKLEKDELEIVGGIRFGRTLGSPVAVIIRNTEFEQKWSEEMSPAEGESRKPAKAPRPGHADLAGMLKYDTHDARDILERASARETAARSVVGHICRNLLGAVDISILSHVVEIGGVRSSSATIPSPSDAEAIDASPVRTFDRGAEVEMVAAIDAARKDRDTLGGAVEVVAHGVMPGLGSHVHADRKLDSLLAGALMSIPAIKAVEIGEGFEVSANPGSQAHDEIQFASGQFGRTSNRAGGIEGGISNGEVITARAYMKPLSTLMRPLDTVDVNTKAKEKAIRERSDVCAVPAAGVVAEAVSAIVLAQELQRKFGGDTVEDLRQAVEAYRKRLASY